MNYVFPDIIAGGGRGCRSIALRLLAPEAGVSIQEIPYGGTLTSVTVLMNGGPHHNRPVLPPGTPSPRDAVASDTRSRYLSLDGNSGLSGGSPASCAKSSPQFTE
ncbi:unnamed protein product [Arctogadus glacialis]